MMNRIYYRTPSKSGSMQASSLEGGFTKVMADFGHEAGHGAIKCSGYFGGGHRAIVYGHIIVTEGIRPEAMTKISFRKFDENASPRESAA